MDRSKVDTTIKIQERQIERNEALRAFWKQKTFLFFANFTFKGENISGNIYLLNAKNTMIKITNLS